MYLLYQSAGRIRSDGFAALNDFRCIVAEDMPHNDNRKSKFLYFDGKSKICEQISKRNFSISVAMI